MHRNFPKNLFFTETKLPSQTCLGTSQGVFQKDKTKGYTNKNWKMVLQMMDMCEWASMLPQNSIFLESPPTWNGHPGEVKWYERYFRTEGDFCDLGQKADL